MTCISARWPRLKRSRTSSAIPGPTRWIRGGFEGLRQRADKIVFQEQRGLVAERMSSGMWEHAMWLRGYEQFFSDMALRPEMVHALMSKELELRWPTGAG